MPQRKKEMIPQYQTRSQPLNINEEFQIFSLWHISDLTNNILNVTINKLIQQALYDQYHLLYQSYNKRLDLATRRLL